VLTLGAVFLPDTPNSLLDRGFPAAAEAVLRRVRGVPDVSVELTDIQHAAKVASQAGGSWRTIFKREYRAELTMARRRALPKRMPGPACNFRVRRPTALLHTRGPLIACLPSAEASSMCLATEP
jgi:hypothetical protein